jgi:hypothetical protein
VFVCRDSLDPKGNVKHVSLLSGARVDRLQMLVLSTLRLFLGARDRTIAFVTLVGMDLPPDVRPCAAMESSWVKKNAMMAMSMISTAAQALVQ